MQPRQAFLVEPFDPGDNIRDADPIVADRCPANPGKPEVTMLSTLER
jgi:hypothetical protein